MNYFYKNFSIDILVAIIIVLAFGGGIIFFQAKIADSAGQIVKTREILADKTQTLQTYSGLQIEYNKKAKKYLDILYNIVPARDQLIDLRQEFQSLASKENLNFGFTFSPGDESSLAPGELGTVGFSINLKGNLDELLGFMQLLEKFRYLVALDSIVLNRSGSSVQMIINGQVYFRQ